MPARATFRTAVRHALVKDGWTITHDPYTLSFGQKDVFVDLGAERPIAAEKSGQRIAVEVKTFLGPSDVRDFEVALGQYVFYRSLIARLEPDRQLYLAVSNAVFDGILSEPIARPAAGRLPGRVARIRRRPGVDRQMDAVDEYRRVVRELIRRYAETKPSLGDVQVEIVFDEANDHYELMYAGWHRHYRIHGSVLHLDIRGGKVWIQYDGTEEGVAEELVKAGIPRDHIVLAFKPPDVRKLTDYAVA